MRGIFDIYSKWRNILHKQQSEDRVYTLKNDTDQIINVVYEWQRLGCVEWLLLCMPDGTVRYKVPCSEETYAGRTEVYPGWSLKLEYKYSLLEWIKQNGEIIIRK